MVWVCTGLDGGCQCADISPRTQVLDDEVPVRFLVGNKDTFTAVTTLFGYGMVVPILVHGAFDQQSVQLNAVLGVIVAHIPYRVDQAEKEILPHHSFLR